MARDNSAYDRASIFSRITYQWIAPTIHKANRPAPEGEDTLGEHDAESIISSRFAAPVVAERFARLYIPGPGEDQEPVRRRWWPFWPFRRVRTHGSIFWSLVMCHAPSLAFQSGLVLLVTAMRLVSPIALRSYLSWLTAYESPNPQPIWKGYLLAVSLGACALGVTVVQHQQPWFGNLLGFLMRQQAIAAIHAKLLLLNAAAVSAISPGFIINLVSNDVRRFDDAAFYWLYAWEAPLELGMVLLMVSLELDFLSALAGISATLALVPMQAFLVRPMASIRRSSAQATDARVRLASEAIQGALACKVLGWEEPLAQELRALRVKEAKHVGAMTRIRATNMALQFVITVLVTFCTFAVYMSRNGTLNVSSVFYAVALLQLPRRSMWSFVQAVQVLTELRVSIQRIQLFLTSPEPPRETHSTGSLAPPSPSKEVLPHAMTGSPQSYPSQSFAASSTTNTKSFQNGLAVMLKGGYNDSMVARTTEASGELPSVLEVGDGGKVSGGTQQFEGGAPGRGQRVGRARAVPVTSLRDAQGPLPKGTVALSGASYDWDRPFGSQGPMQSYGLGALDGSVRPAKKKTTASTASGASLPSHASKATANDGPAPPSNPAAAADSTPAANGYLEHQVVALAQSGLAEPSSGNEDGVKHQLGQAEPRDPENRLTLSGIRLVLRPGELLGVCGEVGSGKSSLLAALLGELQPLDATTSDAATQPSLKPAISVVVEGEMHATAATAAAAAAGTAAENSTVASKFIERDTASIKPGEKQVIHAAGAQQEAQQQQQQAGILMPQVKGHAAIGPDGLLAAGPAWEEQVLTYMDQAGLGSATIVGSLAYCAQVPWVVAGTFRDNILFGSPYRPSWYRQVLRACALEEDVAALPGGDMTELGERGINLSGGQKARLALARAAYQQPDVALLDDPLSAVDPRVGRTLFRECIGPRGTMKGTTRVLATHQRQYLPLCDRVLVIRGGRAVALASWAELVELNLPEIASAVGGGLSLEDPDDPEEDPSATDRNSDDRLGGDDGEEADTTMQPFKAQVNPLWKDSRNSPGVPHTIDEAATDHQDPSSKAIHNRPSNGVLTSSRTMVPPALAPARSWRQTPLAWAKSFGPHAGAAMGGAALIGTSFRRVFSSRRFREDDVTSGSENGDASVVKKPSAGQSGLDQGQLVRAEGRAVGTVSWAVYWRYFRQMGIVPMVLLPLVILGAQAAYIASEWWLSLWARASPADQHDAEWLWVYGMLAGIVVVLGCWRAFMFFDASLRASTRVHDSMVACVLRAPLSFFHTNPAGRVLNRFSKDQGTVDDQLPTVMFDALQCGLLVLGAVVLIAAAVPLVLPVFLPLGFIFMWIRTRYIAASREIKRWEAVTRSPVYATFSSTLKGLATIRAYGAQARFHKELLQQLTANGCWSFAFSATGRWIGFRLDLVAATTMLAAALIAVAMRNSVSPGLLGLALTNLLSMTGIMQWFIRQSAEVENNMTCTERMLEYTALLQEPPRVKEGGPAPPPGWPTSGALTWEGVSSRYRPELPLVLQDVSFSLKPNTVCGVVGRTGSGKSSLALTLFRLIEVTGGRVVLDGVDVATIGIDALRNQLAIIPQDPVLFSGTVRSNLDPWGRHADAALWEVLASVQMRRAVSDLGGLSARLAEAGDNLSVGQRQLFCLARALLQDARVLVLDEATANVDRETDALIHTALDTHVRPQHHAHTAGVSEPANETVALLPAGNTPDAAKLPASAHKQGGLTAGLSHSGRVLLVIAHRIDTIMDSDHLLVLGAGKLQEQGAPHDLAAREGGVFAGMVSAARLTAAVHATEEPSGPSTTGN